MMIGGAFYATFIGGISSLSLAIDSVGRKYGEKVGHSSFQNDLIFITVTQNMLRFE